MASPKRLVILGYTGSGKTTLICNMETYLHYLSQRMREYGVHGEVREIDLSSTIIRTRRVTQLTLYCRNYFTSNKPPTEISKAFNISLSIIYRGKKYLLETIDFGGGLLEELEETGRRYFDNLLSLIMSKCERKFLLGVLISSETIYDEDLAYKTQAGLEKILFNKFLLRTGFWDNVDRVLVIVTKIDKLWRYMGMDKDALIPPTFFNIETYLRRVVPINELLSRIYDYTHGFRHSKPIYYLTVGFEEDSSGGVRSLWDMQYRIRIPLIYGYGYLIEAVLGRYECLDKLNKYRELFMGGLEVA